MLIHTPYVCRRCVGDIFCTVITKSVLRIMYCYILLLCHISFIIGHPSRVRHGKHFYAFAARTRHEINLRAASYKLVPEYFVNSLLVVMTMPRRACAFAQSHQGPAAHQYKVWSGWRLNMLRPNQILDIYVRFVLYSWISRIIDGLGLIRLFFLIPRTLLLSF